MTKPCKQLKLLTNKVILVATVSLVVSLSWAVNIEKNVEIDSILKAAKLNKADAVTVSGTSKEQCLEKLNMIKESLEKEFKVISVGNCEVTSTYVGKTPQNKRYEARVSFL